MLRPSVSLSPTRCGSRAPGVVPARNTRKLGSTAEISPGPVRKWQDGTNGNGEAGTGGAPPGRDPGGTRDDRITGSGGARMRDSRTLASLVRDT
jgi:hypothetical protein